MTQNKDRKTQVRAQMAAEGLSYTQAARLLDLEAGRVPARVIDCHDLGRRTGVAIEDDDLICNGVWNLATDRDRQECGPCEHYDYEAIEQSWYDAARSWLAARGAAWSWSVSGSSRTLTVPADQTDDWADDLWQEAFGQFDAWVVGVMTSCALAWPMPPRTTSAPTKHPAGTGSATCPTGTRPADPNPQGHH